MKSARATEKVWRMQTASSLSRRSRRFQASRRWTQTAFWLPLVSPTNPFGMRQARLELSKNRDNALVLVHQIAKCYGVMPSVVMSRTPSELAIDYMVFKAGIQNDIEASR